MTRRLALPLLLVLSLLLAACQPVVTTPQTAETPAPPPAAEAPATPEPAPPDIVDTAIAAGQFKTLVAALEATDLVAALRGEGPFTVFAPTDEAFAKLPEGTLDALLADPETLSKILLYHVLPGAVMAADVKDGLSAATLEGSPVSFSVAGGVAKINDATIVATDVKARNGVIHVIDTVILPPSAQAAPAEPSVSLPDIVDTAIAAGQFNTLVTAVQAAGLVDALKGEGPFTVFAPTDEAFAKLPAGALEGLLADPEALKQVLLYHVIAGKVMAADVKDGLTAATLQGETVRFTVADGTAKINDATIVATDVEASNGVIHVIDAVILPPSMAGAAESAGGEAPAAPAADIVDTALAAGQFTTLLTAAQAAGLVETLKGPGPFTIFAPTDEAFAKLPAGTVESLLANPSRLKDVLLYHVVSGSFTASELLDKGFVPTLLGRQLPVNRMGDTVMIGKAKVVTADIQASNGVIHVIDIVLVP
ncbi:MAG: fasciclin domain-containing protein [Caldilineales bacterium]|nr:fasciclin domain-containing protein [Caldilineales bacterium]MDW8319574.1 fasciclin domain-containing protein [Anaerolineae bacterium]